MLHPSMPPRTRSATATKPKPIIPSAKAAPTKAGTRAAAAKEIEAAAKALLKLSKQMVKPPAARPPRPAAKASV